VREITHLLEDVVPGTAFVVIEGRTFNNLPDVPEAIRRGAILVITPRHLPYDVPQMVAEDTREAATRLADEVYPEWRTLRLVGITGTNGKTTTAFLLRDALRRLGHPPALIGTVVWDDLHGERPSSLTTPEPFYIRRILGRAARRGARFGVMEVSSIGLAQGRVRGMRFHVGVLTNVGWDHIDYHGSFEEYLRAKLLLFKMADRALINADDPHASLFEREATGSTFLYGEGKGDFPFEIVREDADGLHVRVEGCTVRTRLVGRFNAQNLAAAFGSLRLLGFSREEACSSLQDARPPKGRMERVHSGRFHVFVDYAHTPDAIDRVLATLRPYARRLIVVFGAGGNRDRGKRPKMAEAVERWADVAVLTTDNPRWEEPKRINEDVRAGFGRLRPAVIEDRRAAIEYALSIAREGDVVAILGKGHETYQEVKGRKIPFDDAEVVREFLLGGRGDD